MFHDKITSSSPSGQRAGDRWKKSLRHSEIGVWLAAAMVLATPTLTWLMPGIWERPWLATLGLASIRPTIPFHQAIVGWALVMAPTGVLAFGLGQVAYFLRRMRVGEVITNEIACCVSRLGWSLLLCALLLPLARATALLAIHQWAGVSGLGGMFVPGVMVCALAAVGVGVLAIARVLRHAVALAEENSRFI